MNKDALIELILNKGWLKKKQFIYELFSITEDYTYFILEGKKLYYIDDDGKKISIMFYVPGKPLLDIYGTIVVKADSLQCLDKTIETTVGGLMVNYLLIETPLKGKCKYMTGKINLGKFATVTLIGMLKDKTITIDEYLKVSLHITYIRAFSRLFVTADTIKTMLPPPNIEKLKQAKIKELKVKYGEDALSNYMAYTELSDYLSSIDDEWLKDDPTNGILMSGKVKRSRGKKHFMYGDEQGLEENNPHPYTITEPLSSGYGKDREKIAARFNSIRAGSYARGTEIKMAGVVNNIMTRAMAMYSVSSTLDCNSTMYEEFMVSEQNLPYLKDRTYIGTLTIGKIAKVRSPKFCLEPNRKFCQACVSKMLREIKNGIILFTIDIGGNLSNSFLQKMHGSSVRMVELEIEDL